MSFYLRLKYFTFNLLFIKTSIDKSLKDLISQVISSANKKSLFRIEY